MYNRPNILIVETQTPTRSYLKLMLTGNGYDVLSTDKAKKALKLLKDDDFDILITSLQTPDMNGLKFLKTVTLESPRTVRILFCKQQERELIRSAINQSGIFALLLKPWHEEDLLEQIEKALTYQQKVWLRKSYSYSGKTFMVIKDELERLHPGITRFGSR